MVCALNAATSRKWPRYETVHGELRVTPGPGVLHQWISDGLPIELGMDLRRERVDVAFTSPVDITWGRRDTVVQPDEFVVPTDVWAAMKRVWHPKGAGEPFAFDLAAPFAELDAP